MSVGACWWVYILTCSDGTFYVGITTDLDRRIAVHNLGKGARYTRGKRPVVLSYFESCADRSVASIRERELKSLARSEKFELIAGFRE